jgi:hypothetical protein
MTRAQKFDRVYIKQPDGPEIGLSDVVVIPVWLLKSILEYGNPLLSEPYNSLSDYGKGVVDILTKQHQTLSINFGE